MFNQTIQAVSYCLLSICLLTACVSTDQKKITKVDETNFKKLNAFKGIHSQVAADLSITLDSSLGFSYFIDCEKGIESKIFFKVNNGQLNISADNDLTTATPIKIGIHAPTISSLILEKNGNASIHGLLNSASFDLQCKGQGDITIDHVKTQKCNLQTTGISQIQCAGVTEALQISVAGKSEVNALRLKANTASVMLSGKGDVEVNVVKSLTANISGVGNVYYYGKPIVVREITGQGQVKSKK